jgi:adenine deaminase
VIEEKGGLAFVCGHEATVLPLPIGGLMSADDHATVARRYIALDEKAKRCGGTPLEAPFMTLSFLALLVIPSAKISDKGMFVDFKSVPVSFRGRHI